MMTGVRCMSYTVGEIKKLSAARSPLEWRLFWIRRSSCC